MVSAATQRSHRKEPRMKTFEPRDLIRLPNLGSASAIALGGQLLAALKAEKRLPSLIGKRARRLRRTYDAFARAARDRVGTDATVEDRRDEVRLQENAAWTALHLWVTGWSKIAHEAAADQRREAAKVESVLFGGTQGFVRQRYELAWADADQRLKLLVERELEEAIRSLGGELFLESVRRAHQASADVLGMTKPKPHALKPHAPVKELLDELRDAMREYVMQVSAHALADEDAKLLASRLLAPLAEWEATKRSRTPAPEGAEPEIIAPPPSASPPPAMEPSSTPSPRP